MSTEPIQFQQPDFILKIFNVTLEDSELSLVRLFKGGKKSLFFIGNNHDEWSWSSM